MSPRKKLLLIGAALVLLVFIAITMGGAWDKQTFQRDYDTALADADACLASPAKQHERCKAAIGQIMALQAELDTPERRGQRLRALGKLGACQLAMRQFDAAIASFNKLAAETPQDSAPYRDLALAYSGAGRHAEAERSAMLGVQLAPDSWKPYQVQGRVLYHAEKYPEARAAIEKALSLAPRPEKAPLGSALNQINAKIAAGAPADTVP